MLIPGGTDLDRLFRRFDANEERVIDELIECWKMNRGEAHEVIGIYLQSEERKKRETPTIARPVLVARTRRAR
jgi:hypothetical protein